MKAILKPIRFDAKTNDERMEYSLHADFSSCLHWWTFKNGNGIVTLPFCSFSSWLFPSIRCHWLGLVLALSWSPLIVKQLHRFFYVCACSFTCFGWMICDRYHVQRLLRYISPAASGWRGCVASLLLNRYVFRRERLEAASCLCWGSK